jgi:hypothetical protein
MPLLNLLPELKEMASADSSVAQFMPPKRSKMDIIGAIFEALATGIGTATNNRGLVELGGRGAAMRDRAEQQRQRRAQQIEDEQRKRAQALSDQERSIALQERRRDEDFQRQLIANAKRELPESVAKRHNIEPELLAAGRPKAPQEKAEEQLLVELGLIDDPRYQRLEEHKREQARTAEQESSDMMQKRQIAVGLATRKPDKSDEPLFDEEGNITPAGIRVRNRSQLSTEGAQRGIRSVETSGRRLTGPKAAPFSVQKETSQIANGAVMSLREQGLPRHADLIEEKLRDLSETGAPASAYLELTGLAYQFLMDPDNAALIAAKVERLGVPRTPTPPGTPGVGRFAGGP